MGMVGQIYVRPRQNRVPVGAEPATHATGSSQQTTILRTACNSVTDILCTNPLPAGATPTHGGQPGGQPTQSTPTTMAMARLTTTSNIRIQIHGFDPNFHFVGMTFNPEGFADMKDKYFLLNGRSYPDTVTPGPLHTQSADGAMHFSQPLPAIINIPVGGRALLRISDLDVTEYPDAGLARHSDAGDRPERQAAARSGGQQHVLQHELDHAGRRRIAGRDPGCQRHDKYPTGSVYYLYTPNLDHLSNDAENFGGLMTEVHICSQYGGQPSATLQLGEQR